MDIGAGARWTWLESAVGVLLVGLVVAEIVISSSPARRAEQGLSVDVRSVSLSDQASAVHLAIAHGSSDHNLDLAAFPLGNRPVQQSLVYVYDDSRFPAANVAPTVPQGIFDHLSAELAAREYQPSVVAISADGLANVLRHTATAPGRIVVMMTGVLPANVFSGDADLLSPWVQAGGVAVWGGGAIGFWSGRNGQALSTDDALGEAGTQRLLGSNAVLYPTTFGRLGDVQSPLASALDLTYNFAGAGVLLGSVVARGGLDLGWDSGQFTSVAYLPRGLGGFLMFGGEIPDEASVSVDLARILMSGALYGTGQAASQHLTLTGSATGETVDWRLPFAAPIGGIMLVAFDPSPDALYFFKRQIRR
jgi:hypothetical protein